MMKLFSLLLALMMLLPAAHAEYTVLEPQWPVPEHVTLLLEVASGEIGYVEDRYGNTKYGEWVGDPDTQWCAEFLCWCVDQVDQRYGTSLLDHVYPLYQNQNGGKKWFIKQGRYIERDGFLEDWGYQWMVGAEDHNRNGTYIPQPGDWVFFTWTNDNDTDHVAMVEYASVDENGDYFVHVIEGNNPDCVQRKVYRLKDDRILGYGAVHDVCIWTMRGGNTGAKVSELQAKLVFLGYLDPQYATGTYGPSTSTAVKEVQKAAGLKQSGRATHETQQYINKLYDAAIADQAASGE